MSVVEEFLEVDSPFEEIARKREARARVRVASEIRFSLLPARRRTCFVVLLYRCPRDRDLYCPFIISELFYS